MTRALHGGTSSYGGVGGFGGLGAVSLNQRQQAAQQAASERKMALERFQVSLHGLRSDYEEANANGFDRIFPSDDDKVHNMFELLQITAQRAFEEEACVNTGGFAQRPLLPADLYHLWRNGCEV